MKIAIADFFPLEKAILSWQQIINIKHFLLECEYNLKNKQNFRRISNRIWLIERVLGHPQNDVRSQKVGIVIVKHRV